MKRYPLMAALAVTLGFSPLLCHAQQNDPDWDGKLNPTAAAPAFGAYVDYTSDEFLISGWSKSDYKDYPQITNLPTLYLTSTTTVDFDKKTETYYDATIVLVDKQGTIKQRNETTTFRGRGNATWESGTSKKPWRLKFQDKTSLLSEWDINSGTEVKNYADAKSWTLLSNPFDKSMIRNAVTNELGKIVGLPFCPAYKFVDLVLNGEYFGTYQISDHMEVAKKRVWVNDKTDWYLEICDQGRYGEDPQFSVNGIHLNVKNPDDDPVAIEAMKVYMSNVFTAINRGSGLSELIDLQSLADFMIGMDMTSNYDGVKANGYMYRGTGENDKLKFGPLWDLDLGYGNVGGWASASNVDEKHFWQVQTGYFADFYKNIYQSVEFQMVFYPRWKAFIEKNPDQLLNSKVDEIYNLVKTSAVLNYTKGGHDLGYYNEKWNMYSNGMGLTYSGNDISANYKQACDDIKSFISSHVSWLDKQYYDDYKTITKLNPEDAKEPKEDPTDDSTPGTLVVNTDGTYTFTGSAASFKVGTVIKILTENTDAMVSTQIGGNAWVNSKEITLTANDVNALKAADYTFTVSTSDAVKAITVKAPASQGADGAKKTYDATLVSDLYSIPASDIPAGTEKISITVVGNGGSGIWVKYSTTGATNQWWGCTEAQGWDGNTRTTTFDITDASEITQARTNGINILAGDFKSATITVICTGNGITSTPAVTPTYTLSLNTSEGGTVSGSGTYDENTTVLIKAIANEGYKFAQWSDNNTYAIRSVTLTDDLTLEAMFVSEDSPVLPTVHQQLTNLPTIYLTAETIGSSWTLAGVEVYDASNALGQGIDTWTKEGTITSKEGDVENAVSVQYQGSGKEGTKNSYRLKFAKKIALLSGDKFKQWVLSSNDDDPTMLNNALAKKLGDGLGLPFTPGYQFVDLYVNNAYMGTYQLTDRVKAEEGRALVSGGKKEADWHVRINSKGEINENELDKPEYVKGDDNMPYVIPKNPDPDDLTSVQLASLTAEMKTYFSALFTKDADDHYTAFAENIDKQQLIQWYIAQEVLAIYKGFSSIEAYRSVTETAADQLLHIGVLWDNEKALGNNSETHPLEMDDQDIVGSYKGLMIDYADYGVMRRLFTDLWQQAWFAEGVKALWDDKHATLLTSLKDEATSLAETLSESQQLNAAVWKEKSPASTEEYKQAVAKLTSHLDTRFAYLDAKFAQLATIATLDIPTMLEYILGIETEGSEKADLNDDGDVTIEDLILLLNAKSAE